MLSFLNDIIDTVFLVSSHGSLLNSGLELQLVLVLLEPHENILILHMVYGMV